MNESLKEAKEKFQEDIKEKQSICPCCDRSAKVYSLTLNNSRIASLVWLHGAGLTKEGGWVNVPKSGNVEVLRTNQLSSLKHWGLIQVKINKDAKNKSSGIWRVTELGRSFLRGRKHIPTKVWIYNDERQKFGVALTNMKHVDENFNYEATMADSFKDAE